MANRAEQNSPATCEFGVVHGVMKSSVTDSTAYQTLFRLVCNTSNDTATVGKTMKSDVTSRCVSIVNQPVPIQLRYSGRDDTKSLTLQRGGHQGLCATNEK